MPRNKRLELRLTDDEVTRWTAAAKIKSMSIACFIRSACDFFTSNSTIKGTPFPKIETNPFPHIPRSKFKPCKDCDAPGDRCKRFGSPTCEPCLKAARQST